MHRVLTAAEMREVDRLTVERCGIASVILMENAAAAVVREISAHFDGGLRGLEVLLMAGPGNNGGDGAAIARMLHLSGARVGLVLLGRITNTKGDAGANFAAARAIVDGFFEIDSEQGLADWERERNPGRPRVIVDAVLGTGATRPVSGLYAAAVEVLNRSQADLRVAVDMPTGLCADSEAVDGDVFAADLTVTFTAPKLANVAPPANRANGRLIIADIGTPPELIEEQPSTTFAVAAADAGAWLSRSSFAENSYKNKRGHALAIAGSSNYAGAAVLCGNAAMRSGVGLVTLGVPTSSKDAVASRVLPEVMVRPLAETDNGAISETAFDDLRQFLENVDAVAVGAGLSANDDSTRRFVEVLLRERKVPVIVDADALTLLSPFRPIEPGGTDVILTPHDGEFRRLLGDSVSDIRNDRTDIARSFARKNNVTLVLKGERVIVAASDGRVVINTSGNAGLGKAGNGDTLLGLLSGFVAQAVALKIDIFETVVAAVYVAALAGDLADSKYGKRVMTASDVRECFAEVFESLTAEVHE